MTPNILVIEDDSVSALILTDALNNQGYTTEVADNAEAGWQLLSKNNYDLMLLDRVLPDMDGLELLKRIKQVPALAKIPIVFQTSLAEAGHFKEGLAAGAYYYLAKPYDNQLLLAIVDAALAHSRVLTELHDSVYRSDIAFSLLNTGSFYYQTLHEAKYLGHCIAQLFPEPGKVAIGLLELLINAIEHGNLGISYAEKTEYVMNGKLEAEIEKRLGMPENQHKKALLEINKTENKITLRITDQGNGFDWSEYLEFSPERALDPNGRGIAMAYNMSFDAMHYEGEGNIVCAEVNTG